MKKYLNVAIKLLPNFIGLKDMNYAKDDDAGFDLRAAFASDKDPDAEIVIKPYQRALIPCGIAVAVPRHYELQIRPRSGLALKEGLTILNAPGTIDAGYRGEVGALVFNAGDDPIIVKRGDRIAQGVVAPVVRAHFDFVNELPDSDRGEGGFGHTGTE